LTGEDTIMLFAARPPPRHFELRGDAIRAMEYRWHLREAGGSNTMSDEWPSAPEDTILTLKRRRNTGELEQWTVSGGGDALTVRQFRLDNGNPWQHIQAGTGFTDLAEALERIPELRNLSLCTINEYRLVTAAMEPPVLVGMLEAPDVGGGEAAGEWPDEVAREWADSDSSLQDWQPGLAWVPRWARVNDLRVSMINLGTADSSFLQPVLVDEDEAQFVPIREIASSSWQSESGGAPISWGGGNTLSLLAPGQGYNRPWGDSAEEAGVYSFPDLPETPDELGKALADWVIETDSAFAAALALEPLDSNGVIENAERRAWDKRLAEVTVSFEIDVTPDAQRTLRESLARTSELYRRTRDGLASPRSRDGQALAAALDDALDDGVVGRLTSGQWD
jgi:hypothetical protein